MDMIFDIDLLNIVQIFNKFATNWQHHSLWFLHQIICVPVITRIFESCFKGPQNESLIVTIPSSGHTIRFGGRSSDIQKPSRPICVTILNPFRFCLRMATDPKMGLAESYTYGDWVAGREETGQTMATTLKEFLSLLIRAKRQSMHKGKRTEKSLNIYVTSLIIAAIRNLAGSICSGWDYLAHRLRPNSLERSRQNISEHYDLSNELFKLFLDPSLTYSCALFEELPVPGVKMNLSALHQAQLNKYSSLLANLDIKTGDKVLEIGCGWGAFAMIATEKCECDWTGITVSREQFKLAQKLVKELAESRKGTVDIKYLDYREETGTYDYIVSVEMIEHVGHEYLLTFFKVISERQKPNGKVVIQTSINRDEEYDRYRNSSDFIKKHIFPGCNVPSVGAIRNALPECLKIAHVQYIGPHYVPTLDIWCSGWQKNRDSILRMGYSHKFYRTWEMYFSLCSALFENGNINAVQILLEKS
ncbi:mycolic acid cyclopropane synthetase domain-containing protein [Ditylenchus destructor]|nr:mycolic acid cyclopropane synthetase domain-containing protein [Ditylenchus destructor]